MYGDFEDLETGEVHRGQTAQVDPSEVESHHLPLADGNMKHVSMGYILEVSLTFDAVSLLCHCSSDDCQLFKSHHFLIH